MNTYTTTVGLEVHVELKTKSKMFCGCANNPHTSKPNVHVCPVCLAHPGTLPTVNKEAVKFLMMVGKAIGGTLANYSEFDRKNYFYPDIPKAYQISQYQFPFVSGGALAGVAITRVHLEEDTARSIHDQGDVSLVDFNRAGVPLMELVTEPVVHSAEQAGAFAKELQLLLRTLGVSDANMEKGEMRVEANISVSSSEELGTKVEVKNLNSFKSVESAIKFETARHIKLLEDNQEVQQETMGWDENKSKTFTQRSKETAHDYRYFPDPDIPKFKRDEIEEFSDSSIDEILPETPDSKRLNLRNLGLTSEQIEIIISERERDLFFNKVIQSLSKQVDIKLVANYFTSDLISAVSNGDYSLRSGNAEFFGELVYMVQKGELTSRVAKDILVEVVFQASDPNLLAKERGLLQENSSDTLSLLIDKIIAENQAVVAEYKAGKESVIQFLVGQCMKESRGSANPALLFQLLKKKLSS